MNQDIEVKERLLTSDHNLTCDTCRNPVVERNRGSFLGRNNHWLIWTLLLVSLASIVANVYLLLKGSEILRHRQEDFPLSSFMGKSAYTGLGLDTPTVYHHHSGYWSVNDTLSDELWDSVDTNPMVVALTDEFADAHGLPRSDRFAWDKSKGRYFVKVFHQLHCLKFIRRAFVDLERGKPLELNGRHVHHCLDSLRKDVTCIADDTLMPTGEEARSIGDKQPLMCRNFTRLREWIYSPERNACHRALDDYRSITHPIERYAFCSPKSSYYPIMTRYFEENGHRDPWE
ncbi:hypothetical protein GQ44DRAFT_762659 [Phaeosphaeriaceae sp. PMI808]|nr:hypothetical protein GQ44DRAFT_762659 [Phaeosphaeriaceae sp. PMI808]